MPNEIKKAWYKRWWAIVIFVFIGLIILGNVAKNSNSGIQSTGNTINPNNINPNNNYEIGFLTMVNSAGVCEADGHGIPLFYEPTTNGDFSSNYVLPDTGNFCNGGVRVLVKEQQGDWRKIIVSDGSKYDGEYGWVLKDLVHTPQDYNQSG